jgi:hypothetical protein
MKAQEHGQSGLDTPLAGARPWRAETYFHFSCHYSRKTVLYMNEQTNGWKTIGTEFMNCWVCRCCGGPMTEMEDLAARNPNLCAACSSLADGMEESAERMELVPSRFFYSAEVTASPALRDRMPRFGAVAPAMADGPQDFPAYVSGMAGFGAEYPCVRQNPLHFSPTTGAGRETVERGTLAMNRIRNLNRI